MRDLRTARKLSLPISLLVVSISAAAMFFCAGPVQSSATQPPEDKPIQFTNVTKTAGITFTHFRGNDGFRQTSKFSAPAFASRTSMATAIRIFTS